MLLAAPQNFWGAALCQNCIDDALCSVFSLPFGKSCFGLLVEDWMTMLSLLRQSPAPLVSRKFSSLHEAEESILRIRIWGTKRGLLVRLPQSLID